MRPAGPLLALGLSLLPLAAACGGSTDDPAAGGAELATPDIPTAGAPTTTGGSVTSGGPVTSGAAGADGPVVVSVDDGPGAGGLATAPESPATADPERPLPTTAEALAADLAEVEGAIRDPAVGDDEAAAWGRRQQRLYHLLANHADWVDQILVDPAPDDAAPVDGVDPVVRRAIELNWEARVALDALVMSEGPHPDLPAWRVVDPRPVEELLGYYRDGQSRWGIDWSYLAAINLIETRMGRIEGLSSVGAVGPMQFLPTTWAGCCEGDPTDPADAIPGAAHYLDIRGGPEDMERAIWGYNNSDRYVAAVTAYAEVMAEDELAYRGYHAWDIFFRSTEGLVLIPVGYDEPEPVPAAEWLLANPQYRIAG